MANPNQNSHQNSTVPMLLTTKLNMPLPKSNLVIRQALLDRLNEGLANNSGLFLVSAPAGYGKTTMICEWLNSNFSAISGYPWMKRTMIRFGS